MKEEIKTLKEKLMYLDEEKGFTEEDVKEFIKRLKEEMGVCANSLMEERIDELSGFEEEKE